MLGEWDPFNYCPLLSGEFKGSSIKMTQWPFAGHNADEPQKNNIFQIDKKFNLYRRVKEVARKERLGKYYQKLPLAVDIRPVVRQIVTRLICEYPDIFSLREKRGVKRLICRHTKEILFFKDWKLLKASRPYMGGPTYVDAFDALAMQVQEDLVVQTNSIEGDKTTYIHLSTPNGWNAEWAIGRSFQEIHEGVVREDGRTPVIKTPKKIVSYLMGMNMPIERVGAMSLRTSSALRRFPEPDLQPDVFDPSSPSLFARFERQTVSSVQDSDSFLFTIKTYFLDCNNRNEAKKQKVIDAFRNIQPDANSRDFLRNYKEDVLSWLEGS